MNLLKNLKKKRVIIISIAVGIIILFSIFSPKSNVASFESEVAKRGSITTYYSFSGNINPFDSKAFTAEGNFEVKRIMIEEGDSVEVGDVLYTVDNSDYDISLRQAEATLEIAKVNYENAKNGTLKQQIMQSESAYDSAKLNFENAEKAYNNTKILYEAEIVSKNDFDQARTAYLTAKQQYENAKETNDLTQNTFTVTSEKSAAAQLKQAQASYDAVVSRRVDDEVKAEFSGVVTKIHIEEGDSVVLGTPTIDISDYSQMIATIKIDEYDMGAIKKGKEVICTVDALDKELSGTVEKISKQAVSTGGITYYIADVLLPADEQLLEGMSVEVKALNEQSEDTVTISMKALQFDNENKPFVYLKKGGKMTQKPVTIGINDGLTVEIKEGISEGDTVYYPKTNAHMEMLMG